MWKYEEKKNIRIDKGYTRKGNKWDKEEDKMKLIRNEGEGE